MLYNPLFKLIEAIEKLEEPDDYRDMMLRWLSEALLEEYQRGQESILSED